MITNKEKNFISAVVYAHNNGDTVGGFLSEIHGVLSENYEKFEIICVNDASTDNTVEMIKRVSSSISDCVLSIVNMSYYQGVEISMNAGVDLAIGDFVFEFDTTLRDYDLSLIKKVYDRSLAGYDIVSAGNSKRKFGSKLFYGIYNRNSGTHNKLTTESFRILSRRAINRVHSMSKTLPYRKALYSNCGLKVDTIIYDPCEICGIKRSKQQKKLREKTAMDTLILFTDIAYKVSIWFTLLMMTATVVTGIYVITVFALGQPVPGFTPIMLVMTGSFFGVFAILAIIIKYLSLLVDLVFKRQKYIIESIEKITV